MFVIYNILTLLLGIFFSKDRREEVIEIEETPEYVTLPDATDGVKLMSQGEWMKGCPEGGEQNFLFGLYQHLTDGVCLCPTCGDHSISRRKSDFFALYVRTTHEYFVRTLLLMLTFSLISMAIHNTSCRFWSTSVPAASGPFVSLAERPFRGNELMTHSFIVLSFRVLSLAWDFTWWSGWSTIIMMTPHQ